MMGSTLQLMPWTAVERIARQARKQRPINRLGAPTPNLAWRTLGTGVRKVSLGAEDDRQMPLCDQGYHPCCVRMHVALRNLERVQHHPLTSSKVVQGFSDHREVAALPIELDLAGFADPVLPGRRLTCAFPSP